MIYYAHSKENADETQWQPLREHLENVGRLAAKFAGRFSAAPFGEAAGLLHDIGKYSDEFQARLRGKAIRVDHSTAGAREAVSLYGKALGRLLAYVIAGHHAGLPDFGSLADEASLLGRLSTGDIPRFDAYKQEVGHLPSMPRLPIQPLPGSEGFSLHFFIRFIYSCLVDADFLDTEAAIDPKRGSARGRYPALSDLLDRLDTYLQQKRSSAPQTHVNQWRSRILQSCLEKSSLPPGLFTLTVPTGGGKTLSSLAFALRHATEHGMERIIYVIPYTSIIEQNASVFREALGNDCVLEHHSNFQFAADDDDDAWTLAEYRLKLSTENWDAPIVVTTNVQFFESLFSARSSRCRKLHSIANSVVILDEAQMLPASYLKPSLLALAELVTNYHSTVVLCTATQPAIRSYLPDGMSTIELAPDPPGLYEAFRRVQVRVLGDLADEELADMVSKHGQVLCIVNTRNHAFKLYQALRERGVEGVYHLSARMYPEHRSRKLKEIRAILSTGEPCRVVSTQLVEAGVDVDFPVVYRAMAGVDSIAQAAGRCNREGRLASGDVYVFKPEKHGQPRGWLRETAEVAEIVMRVHDDPLSLEAVQTYFTKLFDVEGERLDSKGIARKLEENSKQLDFPFRWVDREFRVIEQDMIAVIIPKDPDCARMVEEARWTGASSRLSRRLQPYTVQVYYDEYMRLVQNGALEVVAGQYLVLKDLGIYKDDVGLDLSSLIGVDDILISS